MVPGTHSADTVPAVPEPERDRPDDAFAVVVGVYASVVFGPLIVAAGSPFLHDAGARYIGLISVGTVLLIGGAIVARRPPDFPERLGASSLRWVLAVGPVTLGGVVLGLFAVTGAVALDGTVFLVGISVLGGTTVGLVLAMMATSRYAKAVCARVGTEVAWRAGWPPSRRRPLKALGVLSAVGAGVTLLVGLIAGYERAWDLSRILLFLAIGWFVFGQERSYRATPAGLELKAPANRLLRPWEFFEGFEVTDDAIVLRPRAWWRLPVYCDRSEIEDVESVLDTLDRYLDRL